jgi:hypothetical protein
MRTTTVLLTAALALVLARPASAQGNIAGSWITEFPLRLRVINGVESSDGVAQARLTLRLKGDSVLGTWQQIPQGAGQPARTRALRGTVVNGRARVETDPPDERVLRDNEGERRVQMRTRFDFAAHGDSLQGTEQTIAADRSSVAYSRPFAAKREPVRSPAPRPEGSP